MERRGELRETIIIDDDDDDDNDDDDDDDDNSLLILNRIPVKEVIKQNQDLKQ